MRSLVLALFAIVWGCSSSPRFTKEGGPSRSTTGGASSSKPAPLAARSGVLLTLEGVASYYADDFHGKQAANGEVFDMNALTAAHRTFPFGTEVRVTNLFNKKSVVVRVNDRGPFKEGRLIDLSLRAAKDLEIIGAGTANVRLEVLRWGDGTLHHRK
ncbi:MAG: septal ring lytic transglycosylase RlpA family protein [Bacteroidetes bacterium]|jgi:rare lipoprotein A|nr:septal ring lytic transglycosylase RlpA family protein [Bacteroidota bacterium]